MGHQMAMKGQTRDPNMLERIISKTAGDRLRSKGPPIGNDIWSIKWSCAASQEGRLS